jgi:hypothetical protein
MENAKILHTAKMPDLGEYFVGSPFSQDNVTDISEVIHTEDVRLPSRQPL